MFWLTYFALCVVAAVIAGNKGRSGVGFFFLSLFLSPLLGIIAALIASPNIEAVENEQIASGQNKKCPYCAEIIKAEAIVCRYCGKDIEEKDSLSNKDSGVDDETDVARNSIIDDSIDEKYDVLILFVMGAIFIGVIGGLLALSLNN